MSKTEIGEFLAALRKSKGYTQQEAAELLGVSNKTVSSWETGASCPDISMLPALAELYGVTCDEIVRGKRITAAEDDKTALVKREKAMARLLEKQRTNLTTVCWICGALTALGIILPLVLAFAALESLLGFFIGLIFLAASVVTGAVVIRRIRFALGDERESAQVAKLSGALDKAMFLIACANIAALGFICPHITAPVHTGLVLDGETIVMEFACAFIGLLASVLIGYPIYLKQRGRRLQHTTAAGSPDEGAARRRDLDANILARWQFKHVMLMILLPFALLVAAGGAIFAVQLSVQYPMFSNFSLGADSDSLKEMVESGGPFDESEYTLVSEEMPQAEGETGKYAVVYLFTDFPENWRDDYRTEDTGDGTLVTVYKYRTEIQDTGVEILEFYALCPSLQGGIIEIDAQMSEELDGEKIVWVHLSCAPTLGDQLLARQAGDLQDALSWAMFGVALAALAALAVCIPVYVKKERAFRKGLAEKQGDVQ